MSRLRCYFNWLALDGLGPFAGGALEAIEQAGYDGVQMISPIDLEVLAGARRRGLGVCGSDRVSCADEADGAARRAAEAELECVTLHVGWGLESDDEGARLIEAVLAAAERWKMPTYVETHRATLFQDMQRTVEFVRRFPELRFNGDFSHWYTGQEMVYGGFERKLAFLQPVVERVRFVHGRIGSPGCMQVAVEEGDTAAYVGHFRRLWTESFAAYLRERSPEQPFVTFAVELLGPEIYYARRFGAGDGAREESDRWEQSLRLTRMARECFAAAEAAGSGGSGEQGLG